MNRSRRLLLAACAVLAAGSILQFAVPADDEPSDGEAATRSTGEFSEEADRLAFSDDTGRAADRASNNRPGMTDEPSTAKTGADHPSTDVLQGEGQGQNADGQPTLNLPTESFVAAVTTDGVAASPEPGGTIEHWFPNPTQFGGQRVFLVVDQDSSPDHVKVALPVKPNGREGWIPRAAIEITPVNHRAVIDLSDDSVTVWHGDEVIVETGAVTGKPSTPTPVGTFYVRDIIEQPTADGTYGPYIVALSGFSEVLDSFNGGLPALAIHGTDRPDQIGSERSSGCIRIPNDLITLVADSVPLGTPVTIVA